MIQIIVPGPPRGKGRPRFSRRSGRTYTDADTAAYENLVKLSAVQAMAGKPPMIGAVSLGVVAYMPIPASLSAKKKAALRGTWHVKKSDLDNILKAVLDGMNGIVFADDAQICRLHACKVYYEQPRVEINVVEVGDV